MIILGISLGTRNIGFALMRNGELKDYGVKCFKQKWTRTKESEILSSIEKLVEYDEATAIALKSPDPIRSSKRLNHLNDRLLKALEKGKVKVCSYSLLTVKIGLGIKDKRKDGFLWHISELYPELRKPYLKEINNRHSYYDRMFEAIALAKWCAHENE